MTITLKEVINAYGDLVEDKIKLGFQPYFLTFMFNPIPGSIVARKNDMNTEIDKTYSKLLTRHKLLKCPKNKPVDLLPMWIAAPDLPVYKKEKDSYRQQAVNDGLHFHVIALIPAYLEKCQTYDDFIDERQSLFSGWNRYLMRIHVEPIVDNADYMAEYGLKGVRAGLFSTNDILLLPKSKSEQSKLTKWERKQVKIDGELRRRTPNPRAHQRSASLRKVTSDEGFE